MRTQGIAGTNLLVGLALFCSVLAAGLQFYEYFHVRSLVGNGDYPFGCEEAISQGGPAYANRSAYLRSTLVSGIAYAFIILMLLTGLFTRHKWVAMCGTILFACLLLANLCHVI
ncbi:MAG: hypothetical protein QM724_03340 [Flavobacteriales bacterium]